MPLRGRLSLVVVLLVLSGSAPLLAQRDHIPPGYPESLNQDLERLLAANQSRPDEPHLLLQLAEVYLNLGDDWYTGDPERMLAYEQGAGFAKRLWEKEPDMADAHFLYAANLGSLAQIQGMMEGAWLLDDIRKHVEWTLQLNPEHAQALQFLGGLLGELPWILGGDPDEAQEYLEKAIEIDGRFTNARILLAKLLVKKGRFTEARKQLWAVVHAENPHYPYTWSKKFRPQAQSMLKELGE
jgi:tetratricopeptide (TPR) repeat protein